MVCSTANDVVKCYAPVARLPIVKSIFCFELIPFLSTKRLLNRFARGPLLRVIHGSFESSPKIAKSLLILREFFLAGHRTVYSARREADFVMHQLPRQFALRRQNGLLSGGRLSVQSRCQARK